MPRTRKLGILLLTGVIWLAGLFWGISVARQHRAKSSYQEKPLAYWFNELPMTRIDGVGFNATVIQSDHLILRSPSGDVRRYGGWMEKPEGSAKAIRVIGTNALPFYLRKLARQAGPIESKTWEVARAAGFRGFLGYEKIEWERGQAVTALILLKPLPPEAVSQLVALSTNRNREIAAAASCALKTKEKELGLLHAPISRRSVDGDLVKIPIPEDFW